MKIQVFTGKKCPKCPAAKQVASKVAKERKIEYEELDIEEHMLDALQLQIASTPSIVIDDDVIYRGEIPSKEELEKVVIAHEKSREL
jgi:glutaredoxin